MKNNIIIVNYGMGNLNSVKRKLGRIGVNAIISSNPKEILEADKLILPGVGHFSKAVENLKQTGIWEALNESVLIKKTPILGICLGLQLMCKHSEEGDVDGLGWFEANVIHFKVADKLKSKVPHMGWNNVSVQKESHLFAEIPIDSEFYFVHSYHIKSNKPDEVLTQTNYEYDFASGLSKENIYGLQFHPEKSHDVGEKVFSNFIKI
jgi:imidazole glycerol-phosphate synthase subunit HisH